jgi:3-isopropylmalate dehydrogenase
LFEYALNLPEEGKIIRNAVNASLDAGFTTVDIAAGTPRLTSEVGNWIAEWTSRHRLPLA